MKNLYSFTLNYALSYLLLLSFCLFRLLFYGVIYPHLL